MAKARDLEKEVKEQSENREAKDVEDKESTAASEEAEEAAAPEEQTKDHESEEEAAEDAEAAGTSPEKGKKKQKKDKNQEKIDELNDKIIRQMAEFENFRKRTEKEKSQMFETGAKSIIEKILPVVDNFERGLMAVSEGEEKDPFVEGMEMVYRQLMQELENMGVTAIEAVGQEFDPDLHNAVMQTESDEYESGIICQELQKGYKYHDSVVRHSMVAVVP